MSELSVNLVSCTMHLVPQASHLGHSVSCFRKTQLLQELEASEHVSGHVTTLAGYSVVRFHLLKVTSVWIMDEVKAIATRGFELEDLVPFVVFNDQMQIHLRILQRLLPLLLTTHPLLNLLSREMKVLSSTLRSVFKSLLVKVGRQIGRKYSTSFFLRSVDPERRVTSNLLSSLNLVAF